MCLDDGNRIYRAFQLASLELNFAQVSHLYNNIFIFIFIRIKIYVFHFLYIKQIESYNVEPIPFVNGFN